MVAPAARASSDTPAGIGAGAHPSVSWPGSRVAGHDSSRSNVAATAVVAAATVRCTTVVRTTSTNSSGGRSSGAVVPGGSDARGS